MQWGLTILDDNGNEVFEPSPELVCEIAEAIMNGKLYHSDAE